MGGRDQSERLVAINWNRWSQSAGARRRVGLVCIAVRDTHGIDAKNPLPFFAVKQRIEAALSAHAGRFVVVPLPNMTNVIYGREVGYTVERIVLDETIEAISATRVRALSAAP